MAFGRARCSARHYGLCAIDRKYPEAGLLSGYSPQTPEAYRIPALSLPFWSPRSSRRIPRIVWLTNYTRDVTLSIYVNYLFNRLVAPTHEVRLCDDAECEEFIRSHHPELVETYLSLQIGAARADLWRVLVLLTHGGSISTLTLHFRGRPNIC